MDENDKDSDIIGEATIKLAAFCVEGVTDEWYEILYKGASAGHVRLKSRWKSTGEALVVKEVKPSQRPKILYTSGAAAPEPEIAQGEPYYE